MKSELALLLGRGALLKIESARSACLAFEKDNNDCDIVYHPLFSLPPVCSLLYKVCGGTVRVFSFVKWDDKSGYFVVGDPIPKTVRSDNENFVNIGLQTLERFYFWLVTNSHGFSNEVSKGTSHCKTWDLFGFKPNSFRSEKLRQAALLCYYP